MSCCRLLTLLCGFSTALQIDVYGGTRHTNILKGLVHESCFVCKWPLCLMSVCDVLDIRSPWHSSVVKHHLLKPFPCGQRAIVLALDCDALPRIPTSYLEVVVVGDATRTLTTEIREWRHKNTTVHYFPVDTCQTPFAYGRDAQTDPCLLARNILLLFLR